MLRNSIFEFPTSYSTKKRKTVWLGEKRKVSFPIRSLEMKSGLFTKVLNVSNRLQEEWNNATDMKSRISPWEIIHWKLFSCNQTLTAEAYCAQLERLKASHFHPC